MRKNFNALKDLENIDVCLLFSFFLLLIFFEDYRKEESSAPSHFLYLIPEGRFDYHSDFSLYQLLAILIQREA